MSAPEPMSSAAAETAPLSDLMLAMDVVDTLRHNQDLVTRELNESAREAQLIEKLRVLYHQQGIEVSDAVLKEGVAALAESRFVYTPPTGGFDVALARLYVSRKKWAPVVVMAALIATVGLGGYFGIYKPMQAAGVEQARLELAEGLPARMDALYQTIFGETKVQIAVSQADELRQHGKTAAKEGDRAGAEAAIASLTALRDRLRQEYSLRIVGRDGVKSGFWTFPEINTEATNYYIVVEAIGGDGKALSLPILNEENGQTETVALWGLRVPESIYRATEADKKDDGIIEHNMVGVKQFGFLDVDYVVPVLGGAVTRW